MILVVIHIPLLFIYFNKGIEPIQKYIKEEMIKNGYINEKSTKNSKKNLNYKKKKNNKNKDMHSPPKKNKRNKSLKLNSSSRNNIKSYEKEILNNINNKENENKLIINNIIISDKEKNQKSKIKKMVNLPTQGDNNKTIKKRYKKIIKQKQNNNIFKFNFHLITINLNNLNNKKNKDYTPQNSSHILNNYTYEEAIKYDMRSICIIFYIFLLSKQALFHAFLFKSPLELFPLRFCLFIFIFSSDLALNAFFYLDDKISKKYRYTKNLFLFTFNNNITIILLSTLIGFIILTLFTNLSNSINKIIDIFKKEEEKIRKDRKYIVTNKRKKEILKNIEKILKNHKIRVIILIIIEFLFMVFFWYYVTAFCHVYSSTQLSWLLDSFLSIFSRLVIEVLLSLAFAKLYRISIEANINCLYRIVLFFYCFG